MKISNTGLALVMAFEGCMKKTSKGYVPYKDAAGVLTIGWGHTNHHEPKFDNAVLWSAEKCDLTLRSDIAVFEKHVSELAKVPLTQVQFDSLVSWAFNTGGPKTATLWKRLNAGEYAAVPAELRKWVRAGGRELRGLVRRRDAEAELFAGDLDGMKRFAGAVFSEHFKRLTDHDNTSGTKQATEPETKVLHPSPSKQPSGLKTEADHSEPDKQSPGIIHRLILFLIKWFLKN